MTASLPLLRLPYHLPLQAEVGRTRGAQVHRHLQGHWLGQRADDGGWLFVDVPTLPGRAHLTPLLEAFALDLLARRQTAFQASLRLPDALAPGQPLRATLALQATLDPPDLLNRRVCRQLVAHGIAAVKVKVDADTALAPLAAAAARQGLALRLDANGSWQNLSGPALRDRLQQCADLGVAWVEDPVPLAQWPKQSPVPLAHDLLDSDVATAQKLLSRGQAQILVLKPALCGSVAAAHDLAQHAASVGAAVVPSSCFDSPLGLALLAAVVASWPGDVRSAGLATHLGLPAALQPPALAVQGGQWQLDTLWPDAEAWREPVLYDPLRLQALQSAHKLALVDTTGPQVRRWTWLQWDRAVDGQTADMASMARAVPLAVQAETSAASVSSLWAAQRCQRPWLALHPRWTATESQALLARVPLVKPTVLAPLPGGLSVAAVTHHQQPAQVWLPTSGTTGRPKIVQLTWPGLVWAAQTSLAALDLPVGAGWLLALPVCHIAGLQVAMRAGLAGGPLVLVPAHEAQAQLEAIERYRLQAASLVPTQLARWLDAPPQLLQRALQSLRVVLVGGAAADTALLERAKAAGIPLRTTYAMTEASATLALSDLVQPERQGQSQPPPQAGLQLAGRPLPGVEIRAAEDQEISVLCIRSPGLLARYLDDPLPERAAGWWPTGDRGWLDPKTGQLWLAARHTDLIVRGGENIDPLEVEQALPPLPGVLEWAIVGRTDAQLGQQPVCVVVMESPAPGWAESADRLAQIADLPQTWRDALLLLAPFKRPVQFWLRTEPLPRTSLGKLQRALLREQWP